MVLKSLSEIMTSAPSEIESRPVLPAGVWVFKVTKCNVEQLPYDLSETRPKGTQVLMAWAQPVQPVDVDEEELKDCPTWTEEVVSRRWFGDEMDQFCDMKQNRGFVYDCGLDPSEYESTADLVVAVRGCLFQGKVTHAPNKNNPNRPYTNLKMTSPVE